MARVRSRDTAPEMVVRRALTAMGYRYRLHRRDLPGTPDIAFIGRRAAVFVHGCFWHGHGCARGSRAPRANAAYWRDKIAGNRARDARNGAALAALGWRVLTLWECELGDADRLRDALRAFMGPARRDSSRFSRPSDHDGEVLDGDTPGSSFPATGRSGLLARCAVLHG